jgi:ubiquinone/menaquinone biosynthesis C-methylase UbiE
MDTDYVSVTEIAGDQVTQEQVVRLFNRYYWAGRHCSGKDVLEVACGTGQGLGYLSSVAKSLEAGDYSEKILEIARRHYNDRIRLKQFDAEHMPYSDHSKDVIILFEAIYYIPQAENFLKECVRILRPGGMVLIATANKDLYDFNPSPKTHRYYGVLELYQLFKKYGFKTKFCGDTPIENVSIRQRLLRPIKRFAVKLNMIPKSMAAKKVLKRIVFGNLVKMPAEIGPPILPNTQIEDDDVDPNRSTFVEPDKISHDKANTRYKVIYCAASLI